MTEKSARNPTPGSFPHTGSALAAPRPGSGRRRCGDSAEPPWRSGERRPGPPGLGGGGAAAKGPHRSVRGRRAGEGGAAGGARRLPSYDRSWRADRGGARPARRSAHSRAPPRNAAQRRRGGLRERGPAESGGRRRGPEWRPPARVSRSLPSPPALPAAAPTGEVGWGGSTRSPVPTAEAQTPPSVRGRRPARLCPGRGAVYRGRGRQIRRRETLRGCLQRD